MAKDGLAGVLGSPSESEDDDGAGDYDAAKSDAAAAVMAALKADDAVGFESALADFVKLCTE